MFNLYENIKSLCEEAGLSVGAMCDRAGISKSLLSNLNNGRTETISIRSAAKIASALGVSVDDVMHGKKETPTNNGERSDEIDPRLMKLARQAVLQEMFEKLSEEDQYDVILQILAHKQALKELQNHQ